MMYEIKVFGLDIDNVESEGGWQLYLRTSDFEEAETNLEELISLVGFENIEYNWESAVAEEFEQEMEEYFNSKVREPATYNELCCNPLDWLVYWVQIAR